MDTIFLEIDEWISLDASTNTVDLNPEKNSILYPNPVYDGSLYLSTNEQFDRYEIFNSSCQLLGEGKISDNQFSIGDLKGVLIVKLHAKKKVITELIIAGQ